MRRSRARCAGSARNTWRRTAHIHAQHSRTHATSSERAPSRALGLALVATECSTRVQRVSEGRAQAHRRTVRRHGERLHVRRPAQLERPRVRPWRRGAAIVLRRGDVDDLCVRWRAQCDAAAAVEVAARARADAPVAPAAHRVVEVPRLAALLHGNATGLYDGYSNVPNKKKHQRIKG